MSPTPEPYASPLTRAQYDAILAIEAMMANGVEGMFARDGGALPEALADSMEGSGLLASQWMENHPDFPGDDPEGGAAYWPTHRGRFLRGMAAGLSGRTGKDVTFAPEPGI